MNQHSFSLLSVLACSAALLFVACSGDEDTTPTPEGTAGTSAAGSSSGGSGGSGTAGTESGGSGGSDAGAGGSDAGAGGSDAGAGGSDAGSGGSDAGSGGSDAGAGGTDAGSGGSGGQAGPSFATDVKPILDVKCASCHTSGSSGGWQTSDFNTLLADSGVCSGKKKGACVIERIKNGSMPLGKGCSGDPTKDAGNAACLTAEEQDKIQAWVDGGLNP